jgi:hypothetical protein
MEKKSQQIFHKTNLLFSINRIDEQIRIKKSSNIIHSINEQMINREMKIHPSQ